MLDRNCIYMWYWDATVLLALLFTAVVTPYEVAFFHCLLL